MIGFDGRVTEAHDLGTYHWSRFVPGHWSRWLGKNVRYIPYMPQGSGQLLGTLGTLCYKYLSTSATLP